MKYEKKFATFIKAYQLEDGASIAKEVIQIRVYSSIEDAQKYMSQNKHDMEEEKRHEEEKKRVRIYMTYMEEKIFPIEEMISPE